MLSERQQVFHGPTVRSWCGPGRHGMTARRQAMVVHAGFALGFLLVNLAILFGIPMLLPKFEGGNRVGLLPSTTVCLGASYPGKVPDRWWRVPNQTWFPVQQYEDTGASAGWCAAYHHQQQADGLAASRLWSCLLWVLYWPRVVTGTLFQEGLARPNR